MKNWITKSGWIVLIVLGSILLFAKTTDGEEFFYGQIPLACVLLMSGVGIEASKDKES